MASENQSGHTAKQVRRLWLPLVASLCLMLFAGITWLLNSERGAQFVLATASSLSGGVLQTKEVHGQLNGRLQIAHMQLNLENQKIVLDKVELDTRLAKLLLGKLHIAALQIGTLSVTSKMQQTQESATLPDSIDLPLKLQIDLVQVNGGEFAWGPVSVVTLGAFSFALNFDGRSYALDLNQFSARTDSDAAAFSGKFQGQATLAASKPYRLQATITSESETVIDKRNIGASGHLDLQGSLAEIAAKIDIRMDQTTLKGQAMLRPFSDQLLGAAELSAQSLDLAMLMPTWPKTALDIQLRATENGVGILNIDNAAAGLLNQGRIPLAQLHIDFAQTDQQFSFKHILARLGSAGKTAGKIEGNGHYANGALTLTLASDALDLQKLDQRIRATNLKGKLDIQHADGKQSFDLSLSEALKKNRLTLDAHATIADDTVTIDHAALRAGDSAIDASAHFMLNDKQSFDAKGTVRKFQLRDLGDFSQLPALRINGDFSARGARQPALEADIAFHISDSQLAGNPLTGEGQLQLRAQTLLVPKLLLSAGKNKFNAQGKLAGDDARITFSLHAPALEQLGAGFAGAMQVDGEIRGKVQQPHISAEWQGGKIHIPGQATIDSTQGKVEIGINRDSKAALISKLTLNAKTEGIHIGAQGIAGLQTQAQFAAAANAPLALSVHANGISGKALHAENFDLNVSGNTAQHTLTATLVEAKQNWKLTASGGLQNLARNPNWQGAITTLNANGRFIAKLEAPAPLLIAAGQIQLDGFRLNADSANIAIEQFIRNKRGIVTRGQFEHLHILQLLSALQVDSPIDGDLKLSGAWNINLRNQLDGTLNIRRESGDLVMRNNTAVALGLQTLDANITINKGRVVAQFQADGKQTGQIAIALNTSMRSGASPFSIAPNAPVSGSVRVNTPTLNWLGPLLSPTLVTAGSLQSDITLAGSFEKPQFSGTVNADKLRLLFADTGIDLKQGTLRSEFRGDQFFISELSFQNEGSLTISGPLSLVREQLELELSVKASHYKLIDRSDRKLVISGDSVVGWREGSAKAHGKFKVDSGFVDIATSDAPTLSEDVVIVGQNDVQGKQTAIALDIEIALGDGIRLQGYGIDAQLAGQIRLLATAGDTLRAQGTLSIASGTFKAYGRELAIEQGLLRFSGPLNNPALDILAMRRGQEVEAGVSVRGTVLAPRITLVSEPSVADAEKLSWLVLGRGLSGAGDSDINALQNAASALLTQGAAAGLQSQIATAFGLDDFSIGAGEGSLQERIVTLGKQISSRLYVSYKQSLESASSILLLRYTLTPRITLEGEAGTSSALSLFYNFAFD